MAGFVENNELVFSDSKNDSSLVNLESNLDIIKDKVLQINSLVVTNNKLNEKQINRINESIDHTNETSDIRFRYLQNYLPEIHKLIDNDPNIKKLYDVWKSIDFKEGNIDSLESHMNPAMFNKLKELLTVGVNHFDKIASQKFDLIKGGNKKFKKNGTNKLVKKSKRNRTINNKLERKIKYKGGSSLEQLLKSDNNKNNFYTIIGTDNQSLILKDSPILIYFTFNFNKSTDNYAKIDRINGSIEALKRFTDADLLNCAEEFVDIDNKKSLTKDKKKEEINKTLKKYKDKKEERAKKMNKFIEDVKLSGEIYLFKYDSKKAKASNVIGPFPGEITCDLNNGNIKDFTSRELDLDVLNINLIRKYLEEEEEDLSGGGKEDEQAKIEKEKEEAKEEAKIEEAEAKEEAKEEAKIEEEQLNYDTLDEILFTKNKKFDYSEKGKWVIIDNDIVLTNIQRATGIHTLFSDAQYKFKFENRIRTGTWYKIDSPNTSISLTDLMGKIIDGLKDDYINIIDNIASLYTSNNKLIHDKLNKIIEEIKKKHESNRDTLKNLQEKITHEIKDLEKFAEEKKNRIITKLYFVSFCIFLIFGYIYRDQIWDMILKVSGIFSGIAIGKQVVESSTIVKTAAGVASGVSMAAEYIPGGQTVKSGLNMASNVLSGTSEVVGEVASKVGEVSSYFIYFLSVFMTPVIAFFSYATGITFKELLWTIYSLFAKPFDNTAMLNANMNKLSNLLETNDRKQIEYVATHNVPASVVKKYIDDNYDGGSGIYKKYTKTSKNAYKTKKNKTKKNKTKKNKMLGGNNKINNFIALELIKFSANFVGIALGIIDYKTENSLFYDKEYIPNALYNQFLTIRIPF